jgi:hypothetical protein
VGDEASDAFRSVRKPPAPLVLSRARGLVRKLGAGSILLPLDSWQSLAAIWGTGWLPAALSDSGALADVTMRRLRVLASLPISFAGVGARRPGSGPLHLQGTCAALPGHDPSASLWRVEEHEDATEGRLLVEEAQDFLLSVARGPAEEGGLVYVAAAGGRLASTRPVRPGDEVSVFGFADEVVDRLGLSASHGRGGVLPAIRSGSELPLLVTHVVR